MNNMGKNLDSAARVIEVRFIALNASKRKWTEYWTQKGRRRKPNEAEGGK